MIAIKSKKDSILFTRDSLFQLIREIPSCIRVDIHSTMGKIHIACTFLKLMAEAIQAKDGIPSKIDKEGKEIAPAIAPIIAREAIYHTIATVNLMPIIENVSGYNLKMAHEDAIAAITAATEKGYDITCEITNL